jgi:hypothetical protein
MTSDGWIEESYSITSTVTIFYIQNLSVPQLISVTNAGVPRFFRSGAGIPVRDVIHLVAENRHLQGGPKVRPLPSNSMAEHRREGSICATSRHRPVLIVCHGKTPPQKSQYVCQLMHVYKILSGTHRA